MTTQGEILIVDDDPVIREVIKMSLSDLPFELKTFEGANPALDHCKDAIKDIKLIVSDVRMADGDGYHLLENIKDIYSEIPPIIIMTGYSEYSEAEMKRMGASRFLSKPADLTLLMTYVDQELGLDTQSAE